MQPVIMFGVFMKMVHSVAYKHGSYVSRQFLNVHILMYLEVALLKLVWFVQSFIIKEIELS